MLAAICTLSITAANPNVAVMIHGAGGGGWEYRFWKPAFERAGWQVIAPDLVPAKGGLKQTKFTDYVDQVISWVPKKHGKVVLIGASLGGILALKAAERIKPGAVILINGVSPAGVDPAKRKSDPIPDVIRWANGPLKDTRDAMPDSDEATILWAHPQWRDESGSVLRTTRAGVKTTPPTCPVLVVIGTKDTDIPPATSRATATWARADVFEYANTSHVGPLLGRRAKEIAEACATWIEKRVTNLGVR